MGQRETRKAGIIKTRYQDPKLQRSFDAIIERLEVLDGLRGDALDKAVTYRDLSASGFTVTLGGSGGSPSIDGTPGTGTGGGDGPGVGPAAAPTNLVATETFLALLLTWDNPSFNLQHIEVWRSVDDVLANANLIGTTVSPQYVDYVGAEQTYYYWVRAVGTDGTFSAYSNMATGTTGVDPTDFVDQITNLSAEQLQQVLQDRIDLIDNPTTGLVDRVTAVEGDVLTAQTDITSLQSSVSGLNTSVGDNATNISANATLISTQQTSITSLLSDVGDLQGDTADNAAGVVVNSQQILELQASIGALDAEAGQNWEFSSDVEGFTGTNASATWGSNGVIVFTPSAADPQLLSPAFTNISGSINTQVVARVRITTGVVSNWEGNLYYKTTGGWLTPKAIADPQLALSEWQTLTWDMSGESGWINGGVTQIRLDLVSDAAGTFEVDWIQIARVSTSALSEAISALDVRVTTNEGDISTQATALTALESTVDNVDGGVVANAAAISALTTTVNSNTGGVSANSASIVALESTVNDGSSGVVANASAITQLQTDVTTIDGVTTASASDITQLVARIDGAYASIVNPLTTAGEGFGTSYVDADIQAYNDVGGRSGVAARRDVSTNDQKIVYKFDGTRLKVEPRAIYEVKFSLYHNRPTNAGTFRVGPRSFAAVSGGSATSTTRINNGVAAGSTATPYWLSGYNTSGDNQWLDVTCYLLGADVDVTECPDLRINNSTTNDDSYTDFYDGVQVATLNPYVELHVENFNASPTYGDDTTTTLYFTDLQVRRVDSEAANYAALQTTATVNANDIGDLNALYAVQVELNAGGDPYVAGFGLAADVIDGVATSAFGIRADQFFIQHPTLSGETNIPFAVGQVDGVNTVGINGQLVVDGTIRGTSIVAGDIGADQITVTNLSALSADMGTLTAGLLRTAASPAWRVEIEDTASTTWPIWYGSGAKSAGNGLFYVTDAGDVVVKGLLDAGMIKQSYFTPADGNNSFRIACDYPSLYSGGVYTGKKAHLMPVFTTGYTPPEGSAGFPTLATKYNTPYESSRLRVYSPGYSGTVEYGRLGTYSETLLIRYSASVYNQAGNVGGWLLLGYQYDGEPVRYAYIHHGRFWGANLILVSEDVFITRELTDGSWNYLDIWIGVGHEATIGYMQSANLTVQCANFGYADLGGITEVTGATTTTTADDRTLTPKKYL